MSPPKARRESPHSPDDPTAAEWKVLRIVWDRGRVATRDVLAELERETGWSASTVKTLLRRLVEKGHLRTKRIGNSFEYSARRSPLGPLRRAADQLLERAGGDRLGSVLAYLVREGSLRDEELAELRDLIARKSEEPGA